MVSGQGWPNTKWRLQVECLPLLVVDFEQPDGMLEVTLNTGRTVTVDRDHPLFMPEHPLAEGIPAVQLDHGLAALFSRPAWYRLAELCEESDDGPLLRSGSETYMFG